MHLAVVGGAQTFLDLLEHPLTVVLVVVRSEKRKSAKYHRIRYDSSDKTDTWYIYGTEL